ncbi:hypothetical protein EVAR_7435_1 [Eumeta japonica]|uniref:Uncharacterized protein n=1 Tax=Eumeta variegata TaxID=151549 RepID=A0A4C1V7U9_EUMVA|nr:hypothetical protein EVAR_7435_1 [Eumeta japonica]
MRTKKEWKREEENVVERGRERESGRKLKESKKTDLFYHLLRNVSLPFLKHADAQHSELSVAKRLRNRHALTSRSRHEQKEFKEADALLTAAAAAPPRAAHRA